jgi:organic hydroperoxide reductase OsmC/OhrA
MTQIITVWSGGQQKAYCVECADSLPEVQAEIEAADDKGELTISDQPEDALSEECMACHRQIDQVRAESRSYRVRAQITIEIDIDLEADSATEAQYTALWTLAKIHLPEDEIETVLEEHIPMAEQAQIQEWTYEVELAKVIPPDQDIFVSPTQQRFLDSLSGRIQ